MKRRDDSQENDNDYDEMFGNLYFPLNLFLPLALILEYKTSYRYHFSIVLLENKDLQGNHRLSLCTTQRMRI